ncbi:MAG TPA: transposase [Burkholderiaceae bacterium]|nr:transposase [Burkholderiaceae bacterium]
MARLSRLAFAGQAHLVLLAGEATQPLFIDDEDRRRFMLALLECSRASDVALHAYALLDDQILMLATPAQATSLQQFMQRLGRKYVGGFNLRHDRTGALWGRRYGAAAIDAASLGWPCIRLIEQSPVRTGRVNHPQDWPWSSAAHHTGQLRSPVVREHELHWRLGNTPFEREVRHAQMLAETLSATDAAALMTAAMRGRPIGSDAFIESLAADASFEPHRLRSLRPRQRGRPKAEAGSPT